MKIPSAGTPIGVKDLLRAFSAGLKTQDPRKDMEEALKRLIGVKHSFLVNSGTTAFYLILKALLKTQDSRLKTPKTEIILPAYTAPSLVLPIKKLGLSYRLVDVSLETFNMDEEAMIRSLRPETLAVLPVHLFGLPSPIERLIALRDGMEFYIIEDSASSFGTKDMNGSHSGTRGDVGFFSFNRGKNISTVRGGAIITDDDNLSIELKREVDALPEPDFKRRIRIYLEGIGLSLAVRPWFYTIFYPLVSRFKKTSLHSDFESYRYTSFQSALGISLFERAEQIFETREDKGHYLYDALKGIKGVTVPSIPDGWRVVFNQFPIIVDDPLKRDTLIERIFEEGIEATTLYDEPIHRTYKDDFLETRDKSQESSIIENSLLVTHHSSLKIGSDPFPNATYMAKRLLLIPTHHFIPKSYLTRVVEIIRSELSKDAEVANKL